MRRRMRAPGWDEPRRPHDRPEHFGGPPPEFHDLGKTLDRHDSDRDGSLNREEARVAWPNMTEERFGRLDGDNNGLLDNEELRRGRWFAESDGPLPIE
jgi:hypothetical protein